MQAHTLNLRHLRAFCEVARFGSISAASTTVHLSQPAITQALAKLEIVLGVVLFVRTRSGMFTTEVGTLFMNRVERALDNIRTGARRAARVGSRSRSGGFQNFQHLVTTAQLRALIAVSEAGNFSLAARNIGLSQPSLHRMARDLERVSGLTLFVKSAQGIELTPAAQVLMQYAGLAFAELTQGLEEINAWLGLDTATLAIGTLPLPRTYVLPHAVNALGRQRPEVQVKIVDGPYGDLLDGLRHGRLDLLIGALRDPTPVDDVVQTPLFLDSLAIIARSGHPLTAGKRLALGDLTAYPWVAPRPGTPTRQHFDALFEKAGLRVPTQLVETSSMVLVRELLLGSDRLTILSAYQIQYEEAQGSLCRLPFDLTHTSRPIGTTMRRDWQPTATQALFMELLRAAADVAAPRAALFKN